MLMIFYRRVINDTKVVARVVALVDGRGVEVGELKFPTKQVWSKFIGAVQRGALEIPDLEVRMENAPEQEADDKANDKADDNIGPGSGPYTFSNAVGPLESKYPVSNAEARRREFVELEARAKIISANSPKATPEVESKDPITKEPITKEPTNVVKQNEQTK